MKYLPYVLAAAMAAVFSVECGASPPDPSCCRAVPKWYAGISGMAVFLQESDVSHPDFAPTPGDDQTFQTGFGFSGQVGYRLLPNLRAEAEIAERSNKENIPTGAMVSGPSNGTASLRSTALMANAYYDFHNTSRFTPYVGAGVGEVFVKTPLGYINTNTSQASGKLAGWTMGYQFMLGVNYEIYNAFAPMELTLGYRYFTGSDTSVSLNNGLGKATFPDNSHNLEVGGRMFF